MGEVNRANGASSYLLFELSFAVISAFLTFLRPRLFVCLCRYFQISLLRICKRFMTKVFFNMYSQDKQRFVREWVETFAVAFLYEEACLSSQPWLHLNIFSFVLLEIK